MRSAASISTTIFLLGCAMFAGEVTESYDVTIDGKKFSVTGGVITNLTVGDRKVAIGVERAKFKRFDDGTVSFLFPSDLSLEKEKSDAMTSWTLDGNSVIIMLHKLSKEIDPAEFVNDIVKDLVNTYGKGAKSEKCERQFGAKVVKGTRIKAKLAGELLVQEAFTIDGGASKYVIIIQDDEEKTAEGRLVEDKLKETFQIKPGH